MKEMIQAFRDSIGETIRSCTTQAIVKLQEPSKNGVANLQIALWLARMLFYGAAVLLVVGLPLTLLIVAAAAIDTFVSIHTSLFSKELAKAHYYEVSFNQIIAQLEM